MGGVSSHPFERTFCKPKKPRKLAFWRLENKLLEIFSSWKRFWRRAQSWFWSVGLGKKKKIGRYVFFCQISGKICVFCQIFPKDMFFLFFFFCQTNVGERDCCCACTVVFFLPDKCVLDCCAHSGWNRVESICCQNGGANSDFLHSSGREELDSLPIVLELENTLWFSNSCLQLGTNSFAGIVLELCMDRELVAKMGEPIPIFYTLVIGRKKQI